MILSSTSPYIYIYIYILYIYIYIAVSHKRHIQNVYGFSASAALNITSDNFLHRFLLLEIKRYSSKSDFIFSFLMVSVGYLNFVLSISRLIVVTMVVLGLPLNVFLRDGSK